MPNGLSAKSSLNESGERLCRYAAGKRCCGEKFVWMAGGEITCNAIIKSWMYQVPCRLISFPFCVRRSGGEGASLDFQRLAVDTLHVAWNMSCEIEELNVNKNNKE